AVARRRRLACRVAADDAQRHGELLLARVVEGDVALARHLVGRQQAVAVEQRRVAEGCAGAGLAVIRVGDGDVAGGGLELRYYDVERRRERAGRDVLDLEL